MRRDVRSCLDAVSVMRIAAESVGKAVGAYRCVLMRLNAEGPVGEWARDGALRLPRDFSERDLPAVLRIRVHNHGRHLTSVSDVLELPDLRAPVGYNPDEVTPEMLAEAHAFWSWLNVVSAFTICLHHELLKLSVCIRDRLAIAVERDRVLSGMVQAVRDSLDADAMLDTVRPRPAPPPPRPASAPAPP
eukprot:tig00000042_g15434.t1